MRGLVFVVAAALALALIHVSLLDGLDGLFFSLAGKESTYYSQQYSALRFWRIRVGMSEKEVFSILGEPLSRYEIREGAQMAWRYSGRLADTDYRVRLVIFQNGVVEEIVSEYYVD